MEKWKDQVITSFEEMTEEEKIEWYKETAQKLLEERIRLEKQMSKLKKGE